MTDLLQIKYFIDNFVKRQQSVIIILDVIIFIFCMINVQTLNRLLEEKLVYSQYIFLCAKISCLDAKFLSQRGIFERLKIYVTDTCIWIYLHFPVSSPVITLRIDFVLYNS